MQDYIRSETKTPIESNWTHLPAKQSILVKKVRLNKKFTTQVPFYQRRDHPSEFNPQKKHIGLYLRHACKVAVLRGINERARALVVVAREEPNLSLSLGGERRVQHTRRGIPGLRRCGGA